MKTLYLLAFVCLLMVVINALSCLEAELELQNNPTAQKCNSILASGDIFDMSDENINTFCVDNNCPSILGRVYNDMAQACDSGNSNKQVSKLIEEACWKYNQTDCLSLWKMYIYPITNGIAGNFSTTYNLCVQDYQASRTNCSDNCKGVLTEVYNKLNCCYNIVEDVGFPYDFSVITNRFILFIVF
jgi:hypothetical protein